MEQEEVEIKAKPEPYRIEMTWWRRVVVIVLIIVQSVVSFWGILLLFSYFAVRIPFLPYPSMVSTRSTNTHYFTNILLYLLFWAQHIFMATLKYKLLWVSCWKNFALYERYIYNIMSGICLWIMCWFARPSFILLFTIPIWVCIPFILIGVIVMIAGLCVLEGVSMPFTLDSILHD